MRPRGEVLGVLAAMVLVVLVATVHALDDRQGDAQGPRRTVEAGVARVVDGDTLVLDGGDRVRLVGIDTPESGRCGSERATAMLDRLVSGRRVLLTAPVDDRDRYGRLLRYVDTGPGLDQDAGLALIGESLAVARYDSRDGHPGHPREAAYIEADRASAALVCGRATPG